MSKRVELEIDKLKDLDGDVSVSEFDRTDYSNEFSDNDTHATWLPVAKEIMFNCELDGKGNPKGWVYLTARGLHKDDGKVVEVVFPSEFLTTKWLHSGFERVMEVGSQDRKLTKGRLVSNKKQLRNILVRIGCLPTLSYQSLFRAKFGRLKREDLDFLSGYFNYELMRAEGLVAFDAKIADQSPYWQKKFATLGSMVSSNQWFYEGVFDKVEGGSCTLGHSLRYEHVVRNELGEEIRFGICCVEDFFEITNDVRQALQGYVERLKRLQANYFLVCDLDEHVMADVLAFDKLWFENVQRQLGGPLDLQKDFHYIKRFVELSLPIPRPLIVRIAFILQDLAKHGFYLGYPEGRTYYMFNHAKRLDLTFGVLLGSMFGCVPRYISSSKRYDVWLDVSGERLAPAVVKALGLEPHYKVFMNATRDDEVYSAFKASLFNANFVRYVRQGDWRKDSVLEHILSTLGDFSVSFDRFRGGYKQVLWKDKIEIPGGIMEVLVGHSMDVPSRALTKEYIEMFLAQVLERTLKAPELLETCEELESKYVDKESKTRFGVGVQYKALNKRHSALLERWHKALRMVVTESYFKNKYFESNRDYFLCPMPTERLESVLFSPYFQSVIPTQDFKLTKARLKSILSDLDTIYAQFSLDYTKAETSVLNGGFSQNTGVIGSTEEKAASLSATKDEKALLYEQSSALITSLGNSRAYLNDFVRKVLDSVNQYQSLSQKQLAVLVRAKDALESKIDLLTAERSRLVNLTPELNSLLDKYTLNGLISLDKNDISAIMDLYDVNVVEKQKGR